MITILTVLISLIIGLGVLLFKSTTTTRELTNQLKTERELFEEQKISIRKDAQKRSGAVIWGKSIEHLIPFTSTFPVPVEDCKFLGMPIDYVAFSNTDSKQKSSIHFIEVKSGTSTLMKKQKNIKEAVEKGRIYWHEISVESNNIISS